jgi:UDP-N-acetylmuramate-alanine ligase
MSQEFDPIQRGEIAFRLDLTAAELKVTHTALKSLLDDFGHEEHEVQELIRAVLDKLPDEHSIRAIDISRD